MTMFKSIIMVSPAQWVIRRCLPSKGNFQCVWGSVCKLPKVNHFCISRVKHHLTVTSICYNLCPHQSWCRQQILLHHTVASVSESTVQERNSCSLQLRKGRLGSWNMNRGIRRGLKEGEAKASISLMNPHLDSNFNICSDPWVLSAGISTFLHQLGGWYVRKRV